MTDHGHRWEGIVRSGVEHRTHRAQRFDDTSDRSATQRIIAVENAPEWQPGEDAGEQAEARPGVAAIEVAAGLVQPVGARRHDPVGRRSPPSLAVDALDAQPRARAQIAGRRSNVRTVAGARDPALAGWPAWRASALDG